MRNAQGQGQAFQQCIFALHIAELLTFAGLDGCCPNGSSKHSLAASRLGTLLDAAAIPHPICPAPAGMSFLSFHVMRAIAYLTEPVSLVHHTTLRI